MRRLLVGLLICWSIQTQAQEKSKRFDVQPAVHWRTFWMSTTYPEDFKSDYSLGTSLSLGAKMTLGPNWSAQVSYRGFWNVFSSDIWTYDPLANRRNRYETGLYDLVHPGKDAFGSWENLNVQYNAAKWSVALGRLEANSTWINPQDGRLSPTFFEGAKASWKPDRSWELSAMYVHRFRIRGTKDWFRPGETLGIFPTGRDSYGQPSQYYSHTSSDRVTVLEVGKKTGGGDLSFSQTWADNLFVTYWGQWVKSWEHKSQMTWSGGVQVGYQHGMGDGGNPDSLLRYKNPEDQNWVISARIGMKTKKVEAQLNLTKLGGNGRWLSPREWGRDAWFTFISRERNEGYQSVEALTTYLAFSPDDAWSFYVHSGVHFLPDLSDAAANKYAFPSYRQVNLGVKHQFKKIKGLDFHLLVMNKEALGEESLSPVHRYNKVEMIQVNGILNWKIN